MSAGILILIWFIFAAVFAYLAYMQWRLSQETLRPFHLRDRGPLDSEGKAPALTAEQIEEFNQYLESMNARNKRNHTAAAAGFFIATVISLITMVLMYGQP